MERQISLWRELSAQWRQPEPTTSTSSKELISKAYSVLRSALPFLRADGFPGDVNPLELASDALSHRQTHAHLLLGLELIDLAMHSEQSPGVSFSMACKHDLSLQATCQYAHALQCWHLAEAAGGAPPAMAAGAIARCLSASQTMLLPMAWHNAVWVTRQLPTITHRPVWDTKRLPWAPLLRHISLHFEDIRQEITESMRSSIWIGDEDTLRLATNTDWDPRTSWDAASRNHHLKP